MSEDKQTPVIDEAAEQHREMLQSGLTVMTDAADLINTAADKRVRRVREHYFVNNLLPIVRKWLRNDKEDPAEVGVWLNVADGLNNDIIIVDANDKEMFRLPPPFIDIPTRTVNIGATRHASIHQIVQQQDHLDRNGDQRAVYEIERSISDIFAPKPEDEAKRRNTFLLIGIYHRYSLPMEELLGARAEEILTAIKNFDDGTPIFDKHLPGAIDETSEEHYVY